MVVTGGRNVDTLFRVSFNAKPIIVHAKDAKEAVAIAWKYAQQPDTRRITVEPNGEMPK